MLSEQLNLFGEPLRSPRPPANIRVVPEVQDEPEQPETPVLTAVLMPEVDNTPSSPVASEALSAELVEHRALAIEQSMPDEHVAAVVPSYTSWSEDDTAPNDTCYPDANTIADGLAYGEQESEAKTEMLEQTDEGAVVGTTIYAEVEPEVPDTVVEVDIAGQNSVTDWVDEVATAATPLDALTDLVVSHQVETPEWIEKTDPEAEQALPEAQQGPAQDPSQGKPDTLQTGENHDDWSHGKLNIPPDRELFQRQYYTMRETTAMMGMTHAQLRNWENDFDILQPRKNRKGDRYFRPVDIKNLELIYHLIKEKKYTADGARAYLKQHKHALDHFALVKKLEGLKSFLFELKANL